MVVNVTAIEGKVFYLSGNKDNVCVARAPNIVERVVVKGVYVHVTQRCFKVPKLQYFIFQMIDLHEQC